MVKRITLTDRTLRQLSKYAEPYEKPTATIDRLLDIVEKNITIEKLLSIVEKENRLKHKTIHKNKKPKRQKVITLDSDDIART